MIPTKTMQAPPSPPRRHAHYATPLLKLASFEDFLAIKAQTTSIQSPCLSKEESMSQPWPTEDGKDQEMSQESPTCSKAPLCTESGKFVVIKQEIAIPLAKRAFESPMKLERSGEAIFKQYKSQLGYKRFDYTKTLVNNDVYEATDRDIKFLSELNKEILDGCPELTTSQFEKIIECWEHETREDIIITVEEAIAAAEGSMDVTIEDVSILTKIYEYWKNSREEFRRPLLRKYWRAANNEDANPNIAFQRRKENRFARRRSQRMTSPLDDLKRMKNLKKNLDRGRMLLANVRLKEMVKFELQEVRGKTFEEQVRQELGEDLDIELKTPLSTQTGLSEEKYLEVRRKMQEYMTKGESTLKSLKRLKQGALTATKKTYKKHSINSVDTSSSILQEELQPATFKPMPFVLNKLSSYLPRQIQGSFTVPIRKSAIELNELKAKLRQSIGSLYKRDQEELLVKVDLGDTTGSPIIKEPFNACEELNIRLELEERVENLEDGKIKQSTIVRYYINFQEGLQTKTPLLELVPKEPIKFEPNFQPRSDLNVELLSLKKNNSVGKELVLTLSQNKDGLSAGKNSSGEGEIHF